jgi:hypothetical protein
VDQQAMVNTGDIEFNSDGNDIKFENLQRISAADSPVKYVFYKHDDATGTDAVTSVRCSTTCCHESSQPA